MDAALILTNEQQRFIIRAADDMPTRQPYDNS